MSRVDQLVPGDTVTLDGRSATFVAQTEHPIWPSLRLVIWRLDSGEWSHDALDSRQEVGEVSPATQPIRQEVLRHVLLGGAS